jgi:probable phosphoglycerate mutase
VLQRSLAALEAAHQRHAGERILVVCHEGVIKCLLYHLLARQFLPDEPRVLRDFHLHLLALQDRRLYVQRLNHFALAADPDGPLPATPLPGPA